MRVTGIGGGHGLAATLRAARLYASHVSAVVTVADDGGSSGRLTRELGIPPPGDIRRCLAALADDDDAARLFEHRFHSGALTGHTAGNLVIAALAEMTGDFALAVKEAGRHLRAQGEVFPATTALVDLRAKVDGGEVWGQVAVAQTRAPIREVYLTPDDPPACDGAVAAIEDADQILLGPGSLFTSLIATLIVPGIASAVARSSGRKIFLCNVRMQKGETEGLDATAHLDALVGYLAPGTVDVIVVQAPLTPDGVIVDRDALESRGVEVIEADLVGADGAHDPARVAEVLRGLA